MKIGGKVINGNFMEIIPVLRGNETIIFKAQPVSNYDDFDKVCKTPEPPKTMVPGGATGVDEKDPAFIKALDIYAEKKVAYMFIKSLEPTEIEWDTVNMADPETFGNWEKDLLALKFTEYQIIALKNGIYSAQGLDSAKIEAAKESFLAGAQ